MAASKECIVQRIAGYTVMSNHHLRDKRLSLKSKGLLSVILSLPEDWDYTIAGLALICDCGRDMIREALKELTEAGYVSRERMRTEGGQLAGTQYTIREIPVEAASPMSDFPTQVKPTLEEPTLEEPTLGNPTELIKEELITDESNTPSDAREPQKPKRNRKEQPKDVLDAGQLKALLVDETAKLGNQFQLTPQQKNDLYLIAKAWYAPRTLKGKNATPPLHTKGSVTKLYADIRRLAERLGFPTAVEIFQDALDSGHTKINDPRARIGWKPPGGGKMAPAPQRPADLGEAWD